MWTHIDKNTIEKKYGGNLPHVNGAFLASILETDVL
jgi:hypothetical protein